MRLYDRAALFWQDKRVRVFPVLQNHRLQDGIMLISLEGIQINQQVQITTQLLWKFVYFTVFVVK